MKHPGHLDQPSQHILRPWNPREAMTIAAAAKFLTLSEPTVRRLCGRHDLGRRIGGEWRVSRVAARMYVEGDDKGLAAYLSGDRTSTLVSSYFVREGLSCEVLPGAK
ncbi:helix-turn-helix domain-containing protein [Lichenihabitans sp. Uapishka_5]|uniref:helix-turn-helix domain-containing protein n=1 Tax=Lichenihabitans sp. Uapishka_5 TaxID=3037302 RepID=UPI0029E822C6|nr:helix-turn-helix domain-containing protein [Lichenihabitans sp. Uapishka_5]MDX7953391.1 helix-turn-helix domain-containing protein [Lichenihabitans sp. Uapishka_5]